MINYFGYGSNINMISLKAKGVVPHSSTLATLRGWKLVFNVKHWFRHEGGVGNIVRTDNEKDVVQGIVHSCSDRDLEALDRMESYGVGYDRQELELETSGGPVKAFAYVGLSPFIDDSCLPTKRYLNIIIRGAEQAGLEDWYIQKLKQHAVLEYPVKPEFKPPPGDYHRYSSKELSNEKLLTALNGHVFDMSDAREDLHCLFELFGGRDMTMFHLQRLDTSDGNESKDDFSLANISDYARNYLNNYLHAYMDEFEYVGLYENDNY